jgi:hypothetical protein
MAGDTQTTTKTTTTTSLEIADKIVDKSSSTDIIFILILILGILVTGLLIRQSLGKKNNAEKLVEAAAAKSSIAAHTTTSILHEGQGDELQALYARITTLEGGQQLAREEIDSLKLDSIDLKARIRHLEDAMNDLSLHFKNLELDAETRRINHVTLMAIERILGAANA